jgi:hypothetical protein
MRKHLLLVVTSALFGATFATSTIAAETSSEDTIRLTDRSYIERGMSRDTVRAMFGVPSAQLSADVWVYYDFKSVNAVATRGSSAAGIEQQDALIVGFKDGRVSLIRACASEPVRVFIAQQTMRSGAPLVAKK